MLLKMVQEVSVVIRTIIPYRVRDVVLFDDKINTAHTKYIRNLGFQKLFGKI